MIIARLKLNHDLFDRRFAIYTATQDYLVACLNRNGGTQEDTGAFYNATRAAPFLFDKEINDFLTRVMLESINIQVFGKHINNTSLPDHRNFLDTYYKAQQWTAAAHENIMSRFQQSMNLSNIKPFSVNDIIPVPNGQLVKEKIENKFIGKN